VRTAKKTSSSSYFILKTRDIDVDPQANYSFFHIYGWLVKNFGCFSSKPENSGEASLFVAKNFRSSPNLWLLFGYAGKL